MLDVQQPPTESWSPEKRKNTPIAILESYLITQCIDNGAVILADMIFKTIISKLYKISYIVKK